MGESGWGTGARRERGGDGNCTDNWGLLYKDNTRLVGQPNTITILKCFSFDVLCQIERWLFQSIV